MDEEMSLDEINRLIAKQQAQEANQSNVSDNKAPKE